MAGPPIIAESDVAIPSPISVLEIPGSLIKSFPTTFPIARTSPKCSTIVTIATGTAMLIAVISNSGSEKAGIPIHAAALTPEKSTYPNIPAAT